jgi:serine/threonine protein phosphatase PrpC
MVAFRWWRSRTARNDTPRLLAGSETHVGHVRVRNEDVVLIEPDLGLYAVLDGMGGRPAGDVAARLAGDTLAAYVRQQARLRQRWPRELLDFAIRTASVRLFSAGQRRWQYRDMGTTVVACLVVEPMRVVIGHLGDSRAYLLRDGKLAALTRDHSLAREWVEQGEMSPSEAADSLANRMIGQFLGGLRVQPDLLEQTLEPGDRLLLCSDGLHGMTPERSIQRVLARRGTPEQIAHRLVALVLEGEARDNISAVVISVDRG